jgi:hypothetical protein
MSSLSLVRRIFRVPAPKLEALTIRRLAPDLVQWAVIADNRREWAEVISVLCRSFPVFYRHITGFGMSFSASRDALGYRSSNGRNKTWMGDC